jgi:hypothetical protein
MGRENRAADPWDIPQDPELEDLFRAWARSIALSVRTVIPASVVSYVPLTNLVTVQLGQLEVVKVVDPLKLPSAMVSMTGVPPDADATLAPIILTDIPVVWPGRTVRGYATFGGLVTGDSGMVLVSDRSLEAWRLTGAPSDPVLAFTHALKDSVFVPGLFPDTQPIAPPGVNMTATVIHGAAQVMLGGPNAVEHVVKAESLILALIQVVSTAATGSMDGGAAFKAALIANLTALLPSQIASIKVVTE